MLAEADGNDEENAEPGKATCIASLASSKKESVHKIRPWLLNPLTYNPNAIYYPSYLLKKHT